jgi:hypothetical protein
MARQVEIRAVQDGAGLRNAMPAGLCEIRMTGLEQRVARVAKGGGVIGEFTGSIQREQFGALSAFSRRGL